MSDNLPIDPNSINDNFFGDSFGPEDFAPPRVVLGQAMTEDKDEGFFHYPDGTKVTSIHGLVLLVPSKSRVLYRKKGQPSLCRSDNSFVPSPRIENPISKNCGKDSCFASEFGNEQQKIAVCKAAGIQAKNPTNPLCKLSYDLILAGKDRKPFKMSFQGGSLKVIKEKLFTPIRSFGKEVPAPAIEFDMTISKTRGGDGFYYQAVFSKFRAADDRDVCVALRQQFAKAAQRIFSDEYDQRDQENEEKSINQEPPLENYAPDFNDNDKIPF